MLLLRIPVLTSGKPLVHDEKGGAGGGIDTKINNLDDVSMPQNEIPLHTPICKKVFLLTFI
jgi:hypothetical protein